MKSPSQIIRGPVISERSYAQSQLRKYTFRVAGDASKPEIARAIEQHYEPQGIKVLAVNTVTVHGKAKRLGARGAPGRTSAWKKAIVTLAEGQSLPDLFGSV
ncbi:MAG: 50S ribosomal protein L23 [Candidatus Dormibacteraceae bacterium]